SRRSSSWTSVTCTGSRRWSRSWLRTWRAVSPSMTPRRSLPAASSAVYSKAPMLGARSVLAGHAQDFFDRGAAAQDLGPSVITDRRGEGARIALQLVLGGFVMD